jgi:hypothetical protein
MHGKNSVMISLALVGAFAGPAQAAEVAVTASTKEPATASASGSGDAKGSGDRAERPIRRFRPERNMVEIGIFGGFTLFSKTHDLYNPSTAPQEPLRRPTPDLGARAGVFSAVLPRRRGGVQRVAGEVQPGRLGVHLRVFAGTASCSCRCFRVVPFVTAGYGLMGVSSAQTVAGKDIDPVGHYGAGVKYMLNRYLALRLDIRHLIAAQRAEQTDGTSHLQMLLGLSVTLNRSKAKPQQKPTEDADRDRDGFLNEVDKCPDEAGIAPDGCPDKDSDGDSFMDSVDQCPAVPGVAPDGCPPKDRDRDGFLDADDKCPEEPGVAPDGCPLRDKDGDGILDKDDKCVDVPETRNGFEDTDGCPDELPKAVAKFTGVIRGIYFDFGRTRSASSRPRRSTRRPRSSSSIRRSRSRSRGTRTMWARWITTRTWRGGGPSR